MRGLRPIPARLLADDAVVRVPDGAGVYAVDVAVSGVRFVRMQSVVDDDHRNADAGAGKVYLDAVNRAGAFEVRAGFGSGVSAYTLDDRVLRRYQYGRLRALPRERALGASARGRGVGRRD